ncbi:MAG: hypothetical protein WAV40_03990 [Microgenomates group bacterium]
MWYKTHEMLIKAGVIAVVAMLLAFLAIVPIYQNAGKMLKVVKTKSSELDTVSNKVSILSKLDKNVLAERVATMDSALPPKKDVLLYLTSIDGLSRELGLTLGGLTLSPGSIAEATVSATKSTKPQVLQSLATEIKIQGSQTSIYTFLRTIENVLPLMQIKNLSVDVSHGDNYSLSLSLGMLWADPITTNVTGAVTLFGEEEDKYFNQLASFRKFEQLPITETAIGQGKLDLFSQN